MADDKNEEEVEVEEVVEEDEVEEVEGQFLRNCDDLSIKSTWEE